MADFVQKMDDRDIASLFLSIEEKKETPFDIARMEEELKEQISALGIFDDEEEQLPIKPSTLLNRTPMTEVWPPNRFGPVAPRTAGSGLRSNGTGVFTYGFGSYRPGVGPVYQYPPIPPVQVDSFGETKGANPGQLNPAQVHNLTFPVQGNRFAILKQSGNGTGFFLPKVPANVAEVTEPKKQNVKIANEENQNSWKNVVMRGIYQSNKIEPKMGEKIELRKIESKKGDKTDTKKSESKKGNKNETKKSESKKGNKNEIKKSVLKKSENESKKGNKNETKKSEKTVYMNKKTYPKKGEKTKPKKGENNVYMKKKTSPEVGLPQEWTY